MHLLFVLGLVPARQNGPETPDADRLASAPTHTGQYAHVGQSLLKHLGWRLFHEEEYVIVDVTNYRHKGSFDTTMEALKSSNYPKVVLSLFSTALDAAALWASQHRIPVISFSK